MGRYWIVLAASAAAACSSIPRPGHIPQLRGGWFQITQSVAGGAEQSSVLAVEQGEGGVRFVQTNPLGVPLARQIVNERQGWRNDGFVMPNAASRRLFAAMLPMLAEDGGAVVYPGLQRRSTANGVCFSRNRRILWCTAQSGSGWLVKLPGQTQWAVAPLRY